MMLAVLEKSPAITGKYVGTLIVLGICGQRSDTRRDRDASSFLRSSVREFGGAKASLNPRFRLGPV